MRFGWVGFHLEGIPALQGVIEAGVPIQAVFTLRPDVAATRSGAADYRSLCQRFGVPLHEIVHINDAASRELLKNLALDVVFVIGWSQILAPETLRTARVGMIGAHASLLPRNRGSAPINWALIRGEHTSGNSLIWLAGRRWIVWQAALLPGDGPPPPAPGAAPGTVLGPLQSPLRDACGQVVACAHGAVALLEIAADDGEVLRGPRLSEQPWTGRQWTNG